MSSVTPINDRAAGMSRHPAGSKRPGRPPGNKNAARDTKRASDRAERERKIARYEAQEARRAPRLMPDTKVSLIAFLVLAILAIGTAFTVSYSTLVAVAEWMRLENPALNYVVPGFVEVIIILSGIDYIIVRSRGDRSYVPLVAMFVGTGVAVVGNVAHTVEGWLNSTGSVPWQGVIGAALSALAALAVVYLTKRLTTVTFSEPVEL